QFLEADSDYDSDNEIKQQFFEADKLIKEFPIITQKHENNKYTSKLIDTRGIVSELESFKSNQDLKLSNFKP
ncbi:2450_t:CDS:1, partial [Dentiscutata heterogama]